MTGVSLRIALVLSFLLSSTAAAEPTQLVHQGRLLDPAGGPVNGSHTITVAVYDAPTDGTDLWSEAFPLMLESGYFSVVLGEDVDGNPLDTHVLDGSERYLAVSIQDSELSRAAIRRVPYAYVADNAMRADSATRADSADVADRATLADNATQADSATRADNADNADLATSVSGGAVDATQVAINGVVVIDGNGAFVGEADGDTLATLECTEGQVAKRNAGTSSWVCADDDDTQLSSADVLGIVTGAPITLAPGSTIGGATVSETTNWGATTGTTVVRIGAVYIMAGMASCSGATGTISYPTAFAGRPSVTAAMVRTANSTDDNIVFIGDVQTTRFDWRSFDYDGSNAEGCASGEYIAWQAVGRAQ